jgi:hypothetical protein
MNCLDPKSPAKPNIIKGEDKVITIQLSDPKTKDFIDITSASEIVVLFLNQDETVLQKKLSLSQVVLLSGVAGKFQVILPLADTALMKATPADGQSDVEVRLTFAGKLTIVELPDSIEVTPKLFPTV